MNTPALDSSQKPAAPEGYNASVGQFLPYALAVLVLALGVYLNSLRNDFNFDDVSIIKNNSLIRELSNLPKIFASNYWANTPYEKGVLLYRPLVMASFALDYAIWGNNPFGFHLTNILINALNAVLLLLLLKLLFGEKIGPLYLAMSALVFALHPVHTEAINMVVGRTELLAALFCLLAFIFYLQGWIKSAVFSFFLALLSKEIAVTLPVMIFLYESMSGRRVNKRGYFMFAGAFAVYLAIRFDVLRGFVSVHQTGILDKQNAFERALTVTKVLGYYLKLFLVPYPLTPDYSDVALPRSLLDASVLAPVVVIAAMLYAAWKLRGIARMVSYAILWFFVTILPVSNIVSIGAFLGERFLYLPSISAALLAAAIFYYAAASGDPTNPRRVGARGLQSPVGHMPSRVANTHDVEYRVLRHILPAGCILVLGLFAVMTFRRNGDWKDADTLWAKVLAQQPDNPRANFHLGAKYEEQKEYAKAAAFYEMAVKFYPAHNWNPDSKTVATVKESLSHIYYVLSLRLYKANKFPEAIDYGRKALANDDKNAAAYVVLGDIYAQQGDLTKAAEAYQSALRADPEQYEAKENLRRIEAAGKDVRQH